MNLAEDEFLNPIAEKSKPDSGDIIKPVEARHGDHLFCPDHDCKDPDRKLFLKRSSLGNFFFSHRPGFTHPIYPQTLLHKMAVKWFEGKTEFEIPSAVANNKKLIKKVLQLDPSKTQLEYREYQSVIPDIIVETTAGFRIAIEIVVTSDVSADKSVLLHENKLPTICIDLCEFYYLNTDACRTNVDFVKANLDILLVNILLKRWVQLPIIELESLEIEWKDKEKETTSPDGCLLLYTVIVMVILVLVFSSNR